MNARTAGCVTFGHGGGRQVEPLHLAGRRQRLDLGAGVGEVAAGRDAHVHREPELVGHDVAGGAAVRQGDGDRVVELEALDDDRLLLAGGEPAERGGRLVDRVDALPRPRAVRELAAVHDVGVHRPDRAGVHGVAGRLEHDRER